MNRDQTELLGSGALCAVLAALSSRKIGEQMSWRGSSGV